MQEARIPVKVTLVDHWFVRKMVLLSSLVLSVGVLVVLHPTILESMDVSLLSWISSMPTWKVPPLLHPVHLDQLLLLHPPLLDQLLLLPQLDVEAQIGLVIIFAMMKTTMLNATLMVVIAV